MQRLRITFSRGEEIKYISHLDLMRYWERIVVRASIPIAYSEGFNPRPRIALAAPLPVGVTSECELMDIFLLDNFSPQVFHESVTSQLTTGLQLSKVEEVPLDSPSLQTQICSIEYRVIVETSLSTEEINQAIETLLRAEHLPWQQMRNTILAKYDLRPLIENVWLLRREDACCVLGMRLRVTPRGTGRPEQVALALGFMVHPCLIHRVRLVLADNEIEVK